MATTASVSKQRTVGGSFLLEEHKLDNVFTPEDFNEDQQMVAKLAEDFANNEIVPMIERIEHKEWDVTRELLKKASEAGLTNADVPAEYGGSEMDKVSSALIADHIAKSGSFSVSYGAHSGIGTLPIVYFGTEDQKKKYLPRLASGELIGAYALSESTSGSDAMNPRTKAVLAADGKHYVLNGEKMWITNANFADLYIVFAKVDGEKFTAFIVEKTFPGFSVGAEEKKLGIRGSSTAPLILNDCQVPVENLLGEIGKGHIIAFNILNIGRFKLGAACVGGARNILSHTIAYAKQRKAFGKVIADFGLIREKLAQIVAGIYTGEAMVYRTVGMMDVALGEVEKGGAEESKETRKAIEEYAVECSIIKVWASEMLDMAVDETVQVYGGYGFVEEYPAERAYRDSRVNRIFEGTNEINRMIITGFLMKRAISGQLPLLPAIKKVMDEVMAGPSTDEIEGALAAERTIVGNAKKVGLLVAGAASQKYMQDLVNQQEVMGAIADIIIEAFAMESAVLRTQKLIESKGEKEAEVATALTQIYIAGAIGRVEASAKKVMAAVAEGDMLRTQLMILRRLVKHEPVNVIALQQHAAQKVLEADKYAF
ncbi:Butyryl-CoA dehydrogenase [Candidatus Koribacter versatilis Ellin345]|uniref:Butyryl-CoA dehydrogenase n=1 Tax=Koribacter versatilis (strain Ellin345) TaxID=204669 RepID=Q1INS8_KORVE|nr:acyl-CoA dehydrogenase family protein [Candidatus Koribacter versatilis]ABF41472.1 Butyryl-CoA dehydrogenase [Candidatus Koribacter versatilis Ellin345]